MLLIFALGAVSASNDKVTSDEVVNSDEIVVLQDSNASNSGSEKLNIEAIVHDEYLMDDDNCYI